MSVTFDVQRRIGLYGALLSVFAPEGEPVELWTPLAIDPARVLARTVTSHAGTPPRADLRWADPAAKPANDRRLALTVAALPGARAITSPDELAIPGDWVAKALWTAAGRDRCRGSGPLTPQLRTHVTRLIAACGAVVVEPWCHRIVDVGLCATVAADGSVVVREPHGLILDDRGAFRGIDLFGATELERDERDQLIAAAHAAGAAIARTGYTGRFAIDAFAWRDGEARRFHACCEINARLTFGWVAHAYAERYGIRRLGLADPAPAGARVLIAPASDRVTAWIA
ncbi:MAG: hypothetical protein ABI867_16765 [Kofleriaceae bacterium]